MISIIKHGNKVGIAECQMCGCKFTYNTREDVKIEYEMNGVGMETNIQYRYVLCPECMHRITIK